MSQALVILCGGDSSRMGTDKALLPFGDECLLEYMVHKFAPHFDRIYLSVNQRGDYGHLDLDVTEIPDIYLNAGPIGAILSSLTMIVENRCFFCNHCNPFYPAVTLQAPACGIRKLRCLFAGSARSLCRHHRLRVFQGVYSCLWQVHPFEQPHQQPDPSQVLYQLCAGFGCCALLDHAF